VFFGRKKAWRKNGRLLLLWLLGVPIPILLLIWAFGGLNLTPDASAAAARPSPSAGFSTQPGR
jgi:hypothetical protein